MTVFQKVEPRKDLDNHSYQVGNYIVVRYPFGKTDWGYACGCCMVTTGYDEVTNTRTEFPCEHIRAVMELIKEGTN